MYTTIKQKSNIDSRKSLHPPSTCWPFYNYFLTVSRDPCNALLELRQYFDRTFTRITGGCTAASYLHIYMQNLAVRVNNPTTLISKSQRKPSFSLLTRKCTSAHTWFCHFGVCVVSCSAWAGVGAEMCGCVERRSEPELQNKQSTVPLTNDC